MGKNFEELVREACIAESKVRGMSDSPKMSLTALVHECLTRADSTQHNLDFLRRLIDEQPMRFRNSRSFIRQAMRWFLDRRLSSGVPKDTSRMALPSRDDAALELIGSSFGLYMLWALAAENSAKKDPSIFGEDEDIENYKQRYKELKEKADSLIEQINQSFMPSDTVATAPDSNGRSLITFRLAEGKVPVYPLRDCGRRLINHLLDSDPSWALPKPSKEEPTQMKRYAKQAMS